jgi:hypothetical protein
MGQVEAVHGVRRGGSERFDPVLLDDLPGLQGDRDAAVLEPQVQQPVPAAPLAERPAPGRTRLVPAVEQDVVASGGRLTELVA